MKTISLSEREIESLVGMLSVEYNDLLTIQATLKKAGQVQDYEDVGTEVAVISEILRKLKD